MLAGSNSSGTMANVAWREYASLNRWPSSSAAESKVVMAILGRWSVLSEAKEYRQRRHSLPEVLVEYRLKSGARLDHMAARIRCRALELAIRLHAESQQDAKAHQHLAAEERQFPVAGLVDQVARQHRRDDRGQRRTSIHHAAGGARIFRRDIHRNRPHRTDRHFSEEEAGAQTQDGDVDVVRKHQQ